jgi:hypothetical protein
VCLTDVLTLTGLTADLTIKRVIIGVLAMLVVLPALEITSGVYGDSPSLLLAGLSMLHATALTQGLNSTGFQAALSVGGGCMGFGWQM